MMLPPKLVLVGTVNNAADQRTLLESLGTFNRGLRDAIETGKQRGQQSLGCTNSMENWQHLLLAFESAEIAMGRVLVDGKRT